MITNILPVSGVSPVAAGALLQPVQNTPLEEGGNQSSFSDILADVIGAATESGLSSEQLAGLLSTANVGNSYSQTKTDATADLLSSFLGNNANSKTNSDILSSILGNNAQTSGVNANGQIDIAGLLNAGNSAGAGGAASLDASNVMASSLARALQNVKNGGTTNSSAVSNIGNQNAGGASSLSRTGGNSNDGSSFFRLGNNMEEKSGQETMPVNAAATFGDIIQGNFDNVYNANKESEATAIQDVLSESDDLHTTNIASTKAYIALQTLVAIKNTAVDAYKEIMQMSV